MIDLRLGDCLTEMKKIKDKSVDLVLTDPPYKIVVNKKGYGTGFYKKTDHLAKIDESFGSQFNPKEFLTAVKDKAKNGMLIWHSQALLLDYIHFAIENNFKWDLMFWHKVNSCPNHFNHLMCDTEYCIRMYLGGAYFNNELDYRYYHKYFLEGVQSIEGHPTPKPLSIMKRQIEIFSKKGDTILDPFMGSGTTGVAAKELGRNFIGIEIDKTFYELARKRIDNAIQELFI